MQKRVVAVHDISCVGRCSLTVALPILSVAGIETSVLPTAILSTHTGGFTDYTFRDLTDDIPPILSHWESLSLRADAVYIGYLGSPRQVDMMEMLLRSTVAENAFRMLDPVMGDNGSLYAGFDLAFPERMKKLCTHADLITPNLTEASLLLGIPYREDYTKRDIEDILSRLSALGPRFVVLSGVSLEKGKIGAASFDRESGKLEYYFTDRVAGMFHGTGDVFASALLAALLNARPLGDAIRIAVDFTLGAIIRTDTSGTDGRYGVDFESGLLPLAEALQK